MSDRLCVHRGHRLEEGKACPYHGLRFPLPCSPFVTPAENEAPQPYDERALENIFLDRGESFLRVKQEVAAPWYLWMQNTADFNHLGNVHAGFASQFIGQPYDVRISSDKKDSSHKLRVCPKIAARFEAIVGKELPKEFVHVLKFPNLSLTSFMNVFYSFEQAMWAPGAHPGRCLVVTEFYVSIRNRVPKVMLAAVEASNLQILAEDKKIVESWAETHKETGNWLPFEARIRAYCEVLRREGVTR